MEWIKFVSPGTTVLECQVTVRHLLAGNAGGLFYFMLSFLGLFVFYYSKGYILEQGSPSPVLGSPFAILHSVFDISLAPTHYSNE